MFFRLGSCDLSIGFNWPPRISACTALAVGTLMNARGLMELIILNIGLQKGIIQPALFSMMVLMAIVTTLMASPVFELVYGRRARQKGELGAAPKEA